MFSWQDLLSADGFFTLILLNTMKLAKFCGDNHLFVSYLCLKRYWTYQFEKIDQIIIQM